MNNRSLKLAHASSWRQFHFGSQLGEIKLAQRSDLAELWAEYFGQPLPKGISTPLMRRALAYQAQERAYGGLRRTERTALRRWAGLDAGTAGTLDEHDPDPPPVTASDNASTSEANGAIAPNRSLPKPTAPIQPILRPGTRLVRNWQGKSYVVEVRENGFAWKGQSYDSLSAVALAITGAKWSGPRFFRL